MSVKSFKSFIANTISCIALFSVIAGCTSNSQTETRESNNLTEEDMLRLSEGPIFEEKETSYIWFRKWIETLPH